VQRRGADGQVQAPGTVVGLLLDCFWIAFGLLLDLYGVQQQLCKGEGLMVKFKRQVRLLDCYFVLVYMCIYVHVCMCA